MIGSDLLDNPCSNHGSEDDVSDKDEVTGLQASAAAWSVWEDDAQTGVPRAGPSFPEDTLPVDATLLEDEDGHLDANAFVDDQLEEPSLGLQAGEDVTMDSSDEEGPLANEEHDLLVAQERAAAEASPDTDGLPPQEEVCKDAELHGMGAASAVLESEEALCTEPSANRCCLIEPDDAMSADVDFAVYEDEPVVLEKETPEAIDAVPRPSDNPILQEAFEEEPAMIGSDLLDNPCSNHGSEDDVSDKDEVTGLQASAAAWSVWEDDAQTGVPRAGPSFPEDTLPVDATLLEDEDGHLDANAFVDDQLEEPSLGLQAGEDVTMDSSDEEGPLANEEHDLLVAQERAAAEASPDTDGLPPQEEVCKDAELHGMGAASAVLESEANVSNGCLHCEDSFAGPIFEEQTAPTSLQSTLCDMLAALQDGNEEGNTASALRLPKHVEVESTARVEEGLDTVGDLDPPLPLEAEEVTIGDVTEEETCLLVYAEHSQDGDFHDEDEAGSVFEELEVTRCDERTEATHELDLTQCDEQAEAMHEVEVTQCDERTEAILHADLSEVEESILLADLQFEGSEQITHVVGAAGAGGRALDSKSFDSLGTPVCIQEQDSSSVEEGEDAEEEVEEYQYEDEAGKKDWEEDKGGIEEEEEELDKQTEVDQVNQGSYSASRVDIDEKQPCRSIHEMPADESSAQDDLDDKSDSAEEVSGASLESPDDDIANLTQCDILEALEASLAIIVPPESTERALEKAQSESNMTGTEEADQQVEEIDEDSHEEPVREEVRPRQRAGDAYEEDQQDVESSDRDEMPGQLAVRLVQEVRDEPLQPCVRASDAIIIDTTTARLLQDDASCKSTQGAEEHATDGGSLSCAEAREDSQEEDEYDGDEQEDSEDEWEEEGFANSEAAVESVLGTCDDSIAVVALQAAGNLCGHYAHMDDSMLTMSIDVGDQELSLSACEMPITEHVAQDDEEGRSDCIEECSEAVRENLNNGITEHTTSDGSLARISNPEGVLLAALYAQSASSSSTFQEAVEDTEDEEQRFTDAIASLPSGEDNDVAESELRMMAEEELSDDDSSKRAQHVAQEVDPCQADDLSQLPREPTSIRTSLPECKPASVAVMPGAYENAADYGRVADLKEDDNLQEGMLESEEDSTDEDTCGDVSEPGEVQDVAAAEEDNTALHDAARIRTEETTGNRSSNCSLDESAVTMNLDISDSELSINASDLSRHTTQDPRTEMLGCIEEDDVEIDDLTIEISTLIRGECCEVASLGINGLTEEPRLSSEPCPDEVESAASQMTDEHDREEVGVHELVIEQAHMMHQANDGDDASTEVDTFEKEHAAPEPVDKRSQEECEEEGCGMGIEEEEQEPINHCEMTAKQHVPQDVDADIDHLKNRIAALIQEDCSEDAEMPYTFQCSQQPMDESQPASNSASSVDEDADTDDREWVSEPDTHVLQQRAVDEDDGWEHEQTQIRMLLEAEQRLSQSADVLQLLAEEIEAGAPDEELQLLMIAAGEIDRIDRHWPRQRRRSSGVLQSRALTAQAIPEEDRTLAELEDDFSEEDWEEEWEEEEEEDEEGEEEHEEEEHADMVELDDNVITQGPCSSDRFAPVARDTLHHTGTQKAAAVDCSMQESNATSSSNTAIRTSTKAGSCSECNASWEDSNHLAFAPVAAWDTPCSRSETVQRLLLLLEVDRSAAPTGRPPRPVFGPTGTAWDEPLSRREKTHYMLAMLGAFDVHKQCRGRRDSGVADDEPGVPRPSV